jgi:hypothetical protein
MDLVLLQCLPGWEVEENRPRIVSRGENLRLVRVDQPPSL